ncbi:interferon-inducible double-stranded RNA-dependent protein kinase activator A homolog isoform X2 [Carassius gibelio]|uniref:interferon-inducible double-stranded RNA-dependent protein kinase activator A homolog isoform X1 n=1 Tax=Carassius gibelio TaxID=101364 RepID=UPI0022775ADD|nr:interferon-inducible double-stranded RNA-dependent protein kinase activator A homolog isoform X1 [Carassius gibelio]XP_052420788.1 interferon-inducible double-stranded RNA-dependent protein kinase activator A homolog isoform X2 [Carassius gibelio]
MADFQVTMAHQRCQEKTPVQILHEYGIKMGSAPVYELIQADGGMHQPSFMFTVTIADFTCNGRGSTKKAAKHEAAEAALKLLKRDTQLNDQRDGVSPEADDTSNPVGVLQELAMQRVWGLPEYVVCMESGPDHMKEFTVTCRLEGLEESGSGSSKKLARRSAAEHMLGKLQSLSGSTEITWSPPSRVYVESLRHSTGEKISLLRRTALSTPSSEYIQMLLEISLELGFQVTYIDIDELTVNGQYQCLVELSTRPVTVCHGTGMTSSNAHNTAAHNALQYIKMVASKH